METEIGAFRETDREGVIALWELVFADDPPWNEPRSFLTRKLAFQPELVFVARDGERIVGTVLGGYDGVRGWMYHLATHPDERRRGIATRLVRELEVALGRLGCPKLNFQVRADNRDVVGFYEALGYRIEDRASFGKRLAGH